MIRKQHNGLMIRRCSGAETSAFPLTPIQCGAAVFALARLTGMEAPWLPALAGAAVCSLEWLLGKRRWFHSGLLAVLVLSLLMGRGAILDGFCQWYNDVGRICTAGTGTVLPTLEVSGNARTLSIFACWAGTAIGVGFVFLSKLGREVICASVFLLCGGGSLALGRMIDPLPMLLAAAMLCIDRGWKHNALPLCILTSFSLLAIAPWFTGWAGEQSEVLRQQLHIHRYETKYTILPEGRLEPLAESDAPGLVVTMEKPEVLYLRGFTGAELGDGRWMPLDTNILEENRDLLYWLNSQEFDMRTQFAAAASVLETQKNTVTVQNVGACSAYRYIPFTIRSDERLLPEDLRETAAGARYDSFTTIYGGAALLPELMTALEGEDSRYLQAEAAYREFVQAHYLTVPEEMAERLQPWWEKAVGLDAQSAVKAVLKACWPDGVQHDPYYATAAVMTLRHFGIPARYAEGYILPQTTQTTVELTGRHAACWAEVYHDGIGWLPMALTPGRDGETEQEEEQPLPPDTPEEKEPPETEPIAEPEPNGGYQVRIARLLLSGIIIVILLLLLAAAGLILRRNHILKKRQAILNQEDIREAVIWSFADSIQVLGRVGLHRGNGSLDTLHTPIRQRFGPELAEQFESASRINAKALFSSKPMTEPERETVHGFRQCALSCLQVRSSRLSRLWMKYILCVF